MQLELVLQNKISHGKNYIIRIFLKENGNAKNEIKKVEKTQKM